MSQPNLLKAATEGFWQCLKCGKITEPEMDREFVACAHCHAPLPPKAFHPPVPQLSDSAPTPAAPVVPRREHHGRVLRFMVQFEIPQGVTLVYGDDAFGQHLRTICQTAGVAQCDGKHPKCSVVREEA